jgi:phosphatidylglycerol:prolipoprotein diacylglycerol transferase
MHAWSIIWNPDDTLFTVGFLQIKYYNLLWITAFAAGWYVMKQIFQKEGKSLEQLDSLFIYTVLSTMIGARLGHVLFYDWAYYQQHLVEILLPIRENAQGRLFGLISGYSFTGFAGLASHGATIGILIGLYLYVRKFPDLKFSWILDRIVVPVALGAFLVRLGNFFNSEIIGKTVDGTFWSATKFVRASEDMSAYKAMSLTQQTTPEAAYALIGSDPRYASILDSIPFRHPAQLYEGVAYLVLFFVLRYLYQNTSLKDQAGRMFGLFFVVLWSVRFLVEYVKESQGGFESALGTFTTGQWLSIPMIAVGLYLMLRKIKHA